MDYLGPICLAETREAVLGDSVVANTVNTHERPINVGVLRVYMKNAGAKLVDILNGIDQLAHQVTAIPFDPDIFAFTRVEDALPHGRLPEHIIGHDWQVIGRHRAV